MRNSSEHRNIPHLHGSFLSFFADLSQQKRLYLGIEKKNSSISEFRHDSVTKHQSIDCAARSMDKGKTALRFLTERALINIKLQYVGCHKFAGCSFPST